MNNKDKSTPELKTASLGDGLTDKCKEHHFKKMAEFVRHLARISAENDYKAYLISKKFDYTDDATKGASS